MKYLTEFKLFEHLNISEDLGNILSYLVVEEKSKVALLLLLASKSNAYKEDEDVNMIDLSDEFNKFSFVPKKRRKSDSESEFDRTSMPTRIGKIVNNIYKKLKPYLEVNTELTGEFSHGRSFRIVEPPQEALYFIVNTRRWAEPVITTITYEGKTIEAKLSMRSDSWYRSNQFTKEGVKDVIIIKFENDIQEIPQNQEVTIGLQVKSNLFITDKDIEEFVNSTVSFLKMNKSDSESKIEEVKGEDIRFWYHRDNYQSLSGELGSSCMSYPNTQPFLDIYCKNPNSVSLLILKSKQEKLLARALLWKLDNGEYFLDRVYSVLNSDCIIFWRLAIEKGWIYKKRDDLLKGDTFWIGSLSVNLDKSQFNTYPYLDTLCYLYRWDGRLTTDGPDIDCITLKETDGGWEEEFPEEDYYDED